MLIFSRASVQTPNHSIARRLAPIRPRLAKKVLPLAVMLLAVCAAPLMAHEFKAGDIEIGHPWSRETPNGAKVATGYLVLRNHGTVADRLIGIQSTIAAKAEIHEMSVDGEGVMTMRPVEGGIEIPAGGEVALKPGAFHIMFMGLKVPPKEGVKFPGTLTFEKAGTVDVEFAVEPKAGGTDHSEH